MKMLFQMAFVSALAFAAFLLGLHRGIANQWPSLPVQNFTDRLTHSPVLFDGYERLVAYPGKQVLFNARNLAHTFCTCLRTVSASTVSRFAI
jgi:hypothetical protein